MLNLQFPPVIAWVGAGISRRWFALGIMCVELAATMLNLQFPPVIAWVGAGISRRWFALGIMCVE
ncbi:hypothetical protein BUV99_13960, partial [Corynebacterium diphtheriae]